jgi:hypothetical protein
MGLGNHSRLASFLEQFSIFSLNSKSNFPYSGVSLKDEEERIFLYRSTTPLSRLGFYSYGTYYYKGIVSFFSCIYIYIWNLFQLGIIWLEIIYSNKFLFSIMISLLFFLIIGGMINYEIFVGFISDIIVKFDKWV